MAEPVTIENKTMNQALLQPALALIIWSLIVWIWMYCLRIPAMKQAGIDPNDGKHPGSLNGLPSDARAVADNYNHLHEQPTIFYALIFYSHLMELADHGAGGDISIILAWAYVGFRVLHSFIQNTSNVVMVRFAVFVLSNFCLFGLVAVNLAVNFD